MIAISNADFMKVIGIFLTVEQCRGLTIAEINAFREAKRLRKKFQRKKQKADRSKGSECQSCLFLTE